MLDRALAPLTLLTALPLPRRAAGLPSGAYAAFPLVGLLLGAFLLGLDHGARAVLPAEAAAAIVVVGLAALTGALHLDGLADSADGLFGGRTPGERLTIMRDSRSGAFGFVAVSAALLLKWAALAPLEGWLRDGALLLTPALARWAILWPLALLPPARAEGMGFHASRRTGVAQAAFGTLPALAVAAGVFWPAGLALVAAPLLASFAVGLYAVSRAGGLTGDVLGAMIETGEVALLLVIATSAANAWLT